MVNASDYGAKVIVDLDTGERIEGWLLGETPRGLYLSLDPDGKVVRLLPRGTWSRIFYLRDGGKAPFVTPDHEQTVEKIKKLSEKLEEPVSAALERVDHNRTKRLAATIHETKVGLEAHRQLYEEKGWPADAQLRAFDLFVTAKNAYAEVLDEIQRSGLEDVLREHLTSLREVTSRDTLPQVDAQVVSLAEVDEMIQLTRDQDLLSQTDFGRQWLYQPITINIQVGGGIAPEPPPPGASQQKRSLIRSVTGWLKVLAGGALAVTNLGVGAVGVIAVGLPTLGWGTVPIALGVASSTQAGLNAAAGALQDMHTPPK